MNLVTQQDTTAPLRGHVAEGKDKVPHGQANAFWHNASKTEDVNEKWTLAATQRYKSLWYKLKLIVYPLNILVLF